jgi:hypothetical protein
MGGSLTKECLGDVRERSGTRAVMGKERTVRKGGLDES